MKRLAPLLVLAACVSVETSKERPYPCAFDDDCRGGWVCGLERTCHPAEPGPWLCAADGGSASCFGWHCGLEGRCYSKEVGVAQPCDYSQEQDGGRDDCPTGFRCGRENACHARGELRAWRCSGDSDCEGAWRCGPQGVCVDPAQEQPPLTALPRLTVERVSPRVLRARPDVIVGATNPARRSTYAWLTGLDLTCLHHTPAAVGQGRDPHQLETVRLAAPPGHLAASEGVVWVASGAMLTAHSFADGGLAATTTALDFTPRALRSGAEGLWLIGDVEVALFPVDGGAQVRFDAGLNPGESLVDLETSQLGGFAGAYLLTTERLLRSNATGFGDLPLTSAPDGSFAISLPEVKRIWLLGSVFVLMNADAGAAGHLLQGTRVEGRAPLCTACEGLGAPLRPFASSDPMVVTWLCEGADGGLTRQTLNHADCTGSAQAEHARYSHRGDLAWADPYGRVGVGAGSTTNETFGSLVAPVRGNFVTEGGRLLGGSNVNALLLYDAGMVVAGVASVIGEPVAGGPSLVVTASSATTTAFSSVGDYVRPLRGSAVNPAVLGSLLNPSVGTPGPGALLSDGTRDHLIAANGDTLFSADVTQALAIARDGGTVFGPSLQPRLAPSPRLPVLSVRGGLSPADAGHLLSGWALTTNRAVYFEALTERSWVDTPVTLPGGDWVTLLGDRGALRVAYADGQLFTLPSRLAVAEPFGGGLSSRQFASASGVDFALTPAGLQQLVQNPDGGPRGVWRLVPLEATSTEPGFADTFDGGRLVEALGHVFVLSTEWGVWRVTPDAGG